MNKSIRTVVVEDERLARDVIISFLQDIKFVEIVAAFQSGEKALEYITTHEVDLIITDIRLPNISGIDLVESLLKPTLVIITTAYPEYAANAFNLDIVDYLLKPITKPRLFKAVNKVLRRYKISDIPLEEKEVDRMDYIFVKSEYKLIKLNLEDILYLRSRGDYVQLITANQKIMTLQTLRYFQENLPAARFHKIQRSYIVAVNKIKEIGGKEILVGQEYLPVSDASKIELLKKIKGSIF